jgi:hypothetical protein
VDQVCIVRLPVEQVCIVRLLLRGAGLHSAFTGLWIKYAKCVYRCVEQVCIVCLLLVEQVCVVHLLVSGISVHSVFTAPWSRSA